MEKIILRNITLTSIKTIHLIVANIIQCKYIIYRFFSHVSTRTWVARLQAQYTDHWTTEQSRGIGVFMVQLTMHVKSSILCGRMVVRSFDHTSKFFQLDGLLLFCIIIGYALRAPLSSNTTPMLLNFWWKFHRQRSSHKS